MNIINATKNNFIGITAGIAIGYFVQKKYFRYSKKEVMVGIYIASAISGAILQSAIRSKVAKAKNKELITN